MKEEHKPLSAAEKKLIPFYLEKWQNIAISTQPRAREEVRQAVNKFYKLYKLTFKLLLLTSDF